MRTVAVLLLTASVASAAQPPRRDDLHAVAAVRGEPSVISAAGITRADSELTTIENRGAFDRSAERRLVIVGGFADDTGAADAVVHAVRWMKSAAPSALRRRWIVSALPLVDPDGTARSAPFRFPPDKGFFDDPKQPESRYAWRWTIFQAPDLVIVVAAPGDGSAASLVTALGDAAATGLGTVPAVAVEPGSVQMRLPQLLREHASVSPLHDAINTRIAREPLQIARSLARKYPQQVISSYIPSVAWTNMLRLSEATGEPEWQAKVVEQTGPWLSGTARPLTGERTPLTSIAGYMIFAELAKRGSAIGLDAEHVRAAHRLAEAGAALAGALKSPGEYAHGSGWTDDMFMATSVLARVSTLPSDGNESNSALLDSALRVLGEYAGRLQRGDGVFSHAVDGPVAWGRGNGFAAFGMMEALTAMPPSHPGRAAILDRFRRQMSALKLQQAPDGMFRQVIDEPGSYREETATAMLLSAMSRGIRLGWLDRSFTPVVERAWHGLAAHIGDDASLVDVCTGTGSGPTKRYYLDRAAIDGFDDRGGAMALLAAMEIHDLMPQEH